MQELTALFDMDGTLDDFEGQMRKDLQDISSPEETNLYLDDLHSLNLPSHIDKRIRLIKNSPNWWLNLPKFQLGFDLLEIAVELDFQIKIYSKAPRATTLAWSQKVDWINQNIPKTYICDGQEKEVKIDVTVTGKKGFLDGDFLVDDYIPYVEKWLEWKKDAFAIVPANPWNEGFSHPNAIRYDGYGIGEIYKILERIKDKQK